LAKRVPSSVVSATTHTPASGPFLPVTTPPMSSASMDTAAGDCCARGPATGPAASSTPTPATAALEHTKWRLTMAPLPFRSSSGHSMLVNPTLLAAAGAGPLKVTTNLVTLISSRLSSCVPQPPVHGIDEAAGVVERDVMIRAGDLDELDVRAAGFRVGCDCRRDALTAAPFDQQRRYADPVPVRRDVEPDTFRIDVPVELVAPQPIRSLPPAALGKVTQDLRRGGRTRGTHAKIGHEFPVRGVALPLAPADLVQHRDAIGRRDER